MGWSAWVGGSLLLAGLIVPSLLAAGAARRCWLPSWSGAPGWLATLVLGWAIVIGTSQLLGAVGLFQPLAVLAATGAVSVALAVLALTRRDPDPPSQLAPTGSGATRKVLTRYAAIASVAVVAGQWSSHTAESLRSGITAADSLWYHLPRAARFAQTGWVTPLHHTAPEFPDAFHPSNAELIQALPMLMYGRDAVSPLVNLGWMALLLFAAWCVGLPSGRSELAVLGCAALLASPLLVVEGAGNAGNDIAAMFFLLASIAVLIQPGGSRAQVAVGGVAAGLAIATKLTVVPAVAVLTIGVIWSAPRGARARRAVAWAAPLAAFGAYWYVRNLVLVGSPVPSTSLPFFGERSFRIADELGFSVADYLTDGDVWRAWLLPGLRADFGWAWPVVGLVFAATALSALREDDALLRTVGVLLPVSAIAYAVLPTTALGEPGEPVLFAANVIYLVPALLVAMSVLPTLDSMRSPGAASLLLVTFLALLVLGSTTSPIRTVAEGHLAVAVGAGALTSGLGLALVHLRPERRTVLAITGTVVALGVGAGYPVTDRYLDGRYGEASLYRWASSVSDAEIAIAGFAGQFPFYGPNLDSTVTYIGDVRPNGEFHDLDDCAAWRRALRAGGFDHVVLRGERTDVTDHHLVWTRTDPAASPLLEAGGGQVFRFDPTVPDPGC